MQCIKCATKFDWNLSKNVKRVSFIVMMQCILFDAMHIVSIQPAESSHAVAETTEITKLKHDELLLFVESSYDWVHRKISNFHKNRFIVHVFFCFSLLFFKWLFGADLIHHFEYYKSNKICIERNRKLFMASRWIFLCATDSSINVILWNHK